MANPPPLRLAELAATLAVAQDHAFGQPAGAQLRACLLGQWLAPEAGLSPDDAATGYWLALLRFLGCTGHAHEVAVVFGDEIDLRGRSLLADMGSPAEVIRVVLAHGSAVGDSPAARIRMVASMLAGGKRAMQMNFRTGCEVADAFAARLELPDEVRAGLAFTFERWNGHGFPNGAKGDAIPVAMRLVTLCQEAEVLSRVHGVDDATLLLRKRSGKAYDPDLVSALLPRLGALVERLDTVEPWDEVLAGVPGSPDVREGDALEEALAVVADFADLKSPYTGGHSRGVAALAAEAASRAGLTGDEVRTVRHAGLVHDIGRVNVANSVWDKPGPLTRSERDRVETHSMMTEQLLRRSPALAALEPVASAHHERMDASGYHRRMGAAQQSVGARIVAAADCYHAMCEDRAFRPARPADAAAAELRGLAKEGRIDADAADAVLGAAGHIVGRRRTTLPRGLTGREVEVLRLVARGLTTAQIGKTLVISAKTAEHHIGHIYTKIDVSTRGAAALFAIEHDLLRGPLDT
jgi:HD-GYP domain-containing protein (c-di-GMP phosphodiesterase class II)